MTGRHGRAVIEFELSDRFLEAAGQWADQRMKGPDEAVEEKVEQALLEIEHLVSDATAVQFAVEDDTVRHEPSDELEALLSEQAAETGVDESTLLRLHVDLFATVFLDSDVGTPPGTP